MGAPICQPALRSHFGSPSTSTELTRFDSQGVPEHIPTGTIFQAPTKHIQSRQHTAWKVCLVIQCRLGFKNTPIYGMGQKDAEWLHVNPMCETCFQLYQYHPHSERSVWTWIFVSLSSPRHHGLLRTTPFSFVASRGAFSDTSSWQASLWPALAAKCRAVLPRMKGGPPGPYRKQWD